MSNYTNFFADWKAQNTSNILGFGIHDNVVVKTVDTKPRKKQDGSVMKVSMFIKYTQVDVENNNIPLAELEEFVFWPKHDGKLEPTESCMFYMNRLTQILSPFYSMEQINENLNPFAALQLGTMEEFQALVKTKKGIEKFTQVVNEQFIALMTPLMGIKSQYLYRLKVTYQENGKGLEIAKGNFIEGMQIPKEQSSLKMEPRDIRAQQEANKPKAATNIAGGAAPGMPTVPGMPAAPGMPAGTAVPGMPSNPAQPAAGAQAPQSIPGTQPQTTAPSNPVASGMASAPTQTQQPAPTQEQAKTGEAPKTEATVNQGQQPVQGGFPFMNGQPQPQQ